MTVLGDIFLNHFNNIDSLLFFLKKKFNIEFEIHQDGFKGYIYELECFLFVFENHDMENDLNINFEDYKYLIMIETVKFFTDYDSYEKETINITKFIKNIFKENNIDVVSVFDMKKII